MQRTAGSDHCRSGQKESFSRMCWHSTSLPFTLGQPNIQMVHRGNRDPFSLWRVCSHGYPRRGHRIRRRLRICTRHLSGRRLPFRTGGGQWSRRRTLGPRGIKPTGGHSPGKWRHCVRLQGTAEQHLSRPKSRTCRHPKRLPRANSLGQAQRGHIGGRGQGILLPAGGESRTGSGLS